MQLMSGIFKISILEFDIEIKKNRQLAERKERFRIEQELRIKEVLEERRKLSQQYGEGRFY